MNLISWGLDNLYKISSSHLERELLIGYPGQAQYPVSGIITQCKQVFDSDRVKTQAPRYHVMIDRDKLAKYNLQVVRGLQVEEPLSRRKFELVLDTNGSHFDNDSEGRKIVLVMNLKNSC
jgi:hypothetical protein